MNPAATPNDQDRADMDRLVAGRGAALDDLMARHSEKLFHYLIRSLQNEEEAADLAQETFIRVFQNRARFDPKQKFSTWLYAIATNLVKDRFRYRSRHPQVSLDGNENSGGNISEVLPSSGPTPEDALVEAERAEAVRQAVGQLPEDLRVPLILSEYEALSNAEIGEILACSAKAVEMRIYRARKQLRTRLQKLVELA